MENVKKLSREEEKSLERHKAKFILEILGGEELHMDSVYLTNLIVSGEKVRKLKRRHSEVKKAVEKEGPAKKSTSTLVYIFIMVFVFALAVFILVLGFVSGLSASAEGLTLLIMGAFTAGTSILVFEGDSNPRPEVELNKLEYAIKDIENHCLVTDDGMPEEYFYNEHISSREAIELTREEVRELSEARLEGVEAIVLDRSGLGFTAYLDEGIHISFNAVEDYTGAFIGYFIGDSWIFA